MSVDISTNEKLSPKSVLRHRPIGHNTTITTVAQRASRSSVQIPVSKVPEQKHGKKRRKAHVRTATSRSFRGLAGAPHLAQAPTHLLKPQRRKQSSFFQAQPLLLLGVSMLGMLLLWIMLSTVWNWGTTTWDDIHYGRPRTYQTDAWVGHNEQTDHPSHFIVINLNSRIEIIEIAGGDAAHTHIYPGPQLYGAHSELIPVTLRFTAPHGKKYPNMTVFFEDSHITYLNVNGTFVLQ